MKYLKDKIAVVLDKEGKLTIAELRKHPLILPLDKPGFEHHLSQALTRGLKAGIFRRESRKYPNKTKPVVRWSLKKTSTQEAIENSRLGTANNNKSLSENEPLTGRKFGLVTSNASISHSTIQAMLLKIGKSLGYDVYADHRHANSKIGKVSSLCTLPNLTEENCGVATTRLSELGKIDVVWTKDNNIEFLFEVEVTTKLSAAIRRLSSFNRTRSQKIVVAEERRGIKIQEQLHRLQNTEYKFLAFEEVKKFYEFATDNERSLRVFISPN